MSGAVSLAAPDGVFTAPSAFRHPMRCIVPSFFVRCKNYFGIFWRAAGTLLFCVNARNRRSQTRIVAALLQKRVFAERENPARTNPSHSRVIPVRLSH